MPFGCLWLYHLIIHSVEIKEYFRIILFWFVFCICVFLQGNLIKEVSYCALFKQSRLGTGY